MNKQDNFEDNLYLLLIRIKLIQDTLILNTDRELFFTKTLEDIEFVDQILGITFRKLDENKQRIDREGLLDHLFEIEWQFSKVLTEIINGSGSFSVPAIPSLREKLSDMRKASLERRETVQTLSNKMEDYLEAPVISSDELNELLKEF